MITKTVAESAVMGRDHPYTKLPTDCPRSAPRRLSERRPDIRNDVLYLGIELKNNIQGDKICVFAFVIS